ncbi:hypothetical protein M9458_050739, partial [Cirrhinus mrigala]
MLPEKRDAPHQGALALFPVDLKPQMAEVPKHQIPVLAQQILRWEEDTLHEFGKDAGRQRQPKGEDFVLICPTLEGKPKKKSVSRQNRDMKVCVLQVDGCEPILRVKSDATRSSCINLGPGPPWCNCFSALAWCTCSMAIACKAEAAWPTAL